jgi:putative thioredoxin
MMTSDFIIDVGEADFEFEVVAYSHNIPVIVDFWAEWSRQSKELDVLLEKIALEAGGAYRLARVNVDMNPGLALRLSVRSLPTVKAFSAGEVVGEFVGIQPEYRLREFFNRIQPPGPAALGIQKGDALLAGMSWHEAERVFREALEIDPNHPQGLLGLSRALLAQGKGFEANSILTSFPASKQYNQAADLLPYSKELLNLQEHIPGEELDENQAAYWNSVRLAARGKIPAALDGLLDMLRQNKSNQRARMLIVSLLDVLGDDNPLTAQYRKEMSSILF